MKSNDRYAFIVGNGDLAKNLIIKSKEKNIDFIIAGIRGLSDKSLVSMHNNFWFYIGEVQSLFNQLKDHNINKVILVGAITRPSLFALRLDSLGKEIVKKYFNKISGDDSLLRLIIKQFEDNNFQVVGFQEIDNSLLSKEGILTNVKPSLENEKDIENGFKLAKDLSRFDIGQSIIYQQNMVIAVEGVEGTAKMILRSKKILKKEGSKGILIKIKKDSQDIRVDLPTIGDKTIKQVKKSGLAGIVIESKYTIILNYEKTISLANKYGIFIISL